MSDLDLPADEVPVRAPLSAPRAKLAEQWKTAILSVLALALLAGGVFPLLVFAIAGPLFPHKLRVAW